MALLSVEGLTKVHCPRQQINQFPIWQLPILFLNTYAVFDLKSESINKPQNFMQLIGIIHKLK